MIKPKDLILGVFVAGVTKSYEQKIQDLVHNYSLILSMVKHSKQECSVLSQSMWYHANIYRTATSTV